jgi:hypothetical protein
MTTGNDWMDQVRQLVDAVRGGEAGRPGTAAPGESAPGTAEDHGAGDHGSDCRWCPICQAAAVLRGERPEVTAALADVLTTAATALRSFAEEPSGPAGPEGPGEGEQTPDEEPPPAVQRIEIA